MPRTHAIRFVTTLAILLTSPSPGRAQAITPDSAFRSFLRVAELTGKPAADLARIWPVASGSTALPADLQLTAAHRLSVTLAPAPGGTAGGTVRVVTYAERLPDTLRLRARVVQLQQQLQATLGKPTRCTSPLGPPAYLFAPQDVARVWELGIGGVSTALRWEVTNDALPSITITVGQVPTMASALLLCGARMP